MNEIKRVPLFQQVCYLLNSMHLYGVSAALRWLAWRSSYPALAYSFYEKPELVCGYQGWYWHRRLGIIAFVTPEGALQFKW